MNRKISLASRLSLYATLVGGVLFFCALFFSYLIGKQSVMEEAHRRSEAILETIELRIENIESEIERSFNDLSWYICQCDTKEQVVTLLKRTIVNIPMIDGAVVGMEPWLLEEKQTFVTPYVARLNDSTIVDNDSLHGDYLTAEWYTVPKEMNRSVWCYPHREEKDADSRYVSFSVPLKTEEGVFFGVCAASISFEWFHLFVDKLKPYPDAEIFIVDQSGQYIYSPLSGDGIDHTLNRDTVVFQKRINDGTWHVGVICPKENLLEGLYHFNIVMALIMIIGLGLLYFIMGAVIRRATKPLKQFQEAAQTIAQGNFNAPMPELKYHDELHELSKSITYMQMSLTDYIDQLQQTTAQKERIESELAIAAAIQRAILTSHFPQHGSYVHFATLLPAREVGGDLYDVIFRDNKIFFIVGDVSGKSVPASLFMSVAVYIFRTMASQEDDPAKIVTIINEVISKENKMSMFITAIAGVVDLSCNKMVLCNCGHNPPLLKTTEGTTVIEPNINIALGLMEGYPFETDTYSFEPDTTFVVYTDGVTESVNANNEEFSEAKLMQVVAQVQKNTPQVIVDEVLKSVADHAAGTEQFDDITLFAIMRSGGNE